MAEALYRKYRPSSFSDVTGQEHVKTTLQNQIAAGSVAHAYLFSGPRGIGKTTMARLLAKAVNCGDREKDSGEACGKCERCKDFQDGRAMHVVEIDAASHTGVDNVRENIIEASRVSPGADLMKVFIIDEVHMLSTSAFNALLKTLEEPPAQAMFVLATTEIHKIPQTILSRCQRFDFHRIGGEEMTKRLKMLVKKEKMQVDDEVLASIVRLSEGCLRDAESLLSQVMALDEKKVTAEQASLVLPMTHVSSIVEFLEALSRNDAKAAVEGLSVFVEQGGSMKHFTEELIAFVRSMLLLSLGAATSAYDGDTTAKQKELAQVMGTVKLRTLLDKLIALRGKSTPDLFPQLPMELLVVEFCGEPVKEDKGSDDPPDTPTASVEPPDTKQSEEGPSPVAPSVVEDEDEAREPASFSVDDLVAKWGRCCEEVAKKNIALPLVLKTAMPMEVSGSQVKVGFSHRFHFDTINQPKNCELLRGAINTILQTNISVVPVFIQTEGDVVVGNLVEAFGGKVVE